jgi:hypothetical protein
MKLVFSGELIVNGQRLRALEIRRLQCENLEENLGEPNSTLTRCGDETSEQQAAHEG